MIKQILNYEYSQNSKQFFNYSSKSLTFRDSRQETAYQTSKIIAYMDTGKSISKLNIILAVCLLTATFM